MSIVKQKNKRTGTIYVYESKSYWDKEKQQPRSKRTFLGKLDEETGEIVPTDGRNKKRTESVSGNTSLCDVRNQQLREKDILIKQLSIRNKELEKGLASLLDEIKNILGKYEERKQPRP